MIPNEETRIGNRVRRKRDGRWGILGSMSDYDNPWVVWDDVPDEQVRCYWYELDAIPRGPGIGAVVAMVAAARMVRGGWMDQGQMVGRGLQPRGVRHWGFGPDGVRSSRSASCGDFWTDECFDNPWQQYDDSTAALSSVDCPDCLAIARKAGILKESNA